MSVTPKPIYRTRNGVLYHGDAQKVFQTKWFKPLRNNIDLIFTSPPFPLRRSKSYGNLTGQKYIDWLSDYAIDFKNLLTPTGSLVIEVGNAWNPKEPTMSVISMEALLELKKKGSFYLCEEFIWNNTAKLPSPAQWVNIERIRVKDAFTRIWWLSKTPRPYADNRAILSDYSPAMKSLLKRRKYNSGKRPSEHKIGATSFFLDHGGAIPSNVLSIPNTNYDDLYLNHCRKYGLKTHPARMPPKVVEFFILFLTKTGDAVLDPFAGSNTTGFVAERMNRKWRSIEIDYRYAVASKSRFPNAWMMNR